MLFAALSSPLSKELVLVPGTLCCPWSRPNPACFLASHYEGVTCWFIVVLFRRFLPVKHEVKISAFKRKYKGWTSQSCGLGFASLFLHIVRKSHDWKEIHPGPRGVVEKPTALEEYPTGELFMRNINLGKLKLVIPWNSRTNPIMQHWSKKDFKGSQMKSSKKNTP